MDSNTRNTLAREDHVSRTQAYADDMEQATIAAVQKAEAQRRHVIASTYDKEQEHIQEQYAKVQEHVRMEVNEVQNTRRQTQLDADSKLMEAVCKASLAEYTEIQRIQSIARLHEKEWSQTQVTIDNKKQEKDQCRVARQTAMTNVIESKKKAHALKAKAEEAIAAYEVKAIERVEKLAHFENQDRVGQHHENLKTIHAAKKEAQSNKSKVVSNVIEKKLRAQELIEQARLATEKCEKMKLETLHQSSIIESSTAVTKNEQALAAVQERKQAASIQRQLAEHKATVARERAGLLKQKAAAAAEALKQKRDATAERFKHLGPATA